MKNNIIVLLVGTFAWTCHAAKQRMQAVCVDLGEEFGPQTLKVSKDKVKWITKRGATLGHCQVAKRLPKKELAPRSFCKQFAPRSERGAYSTIKAPKAATEFLLSHNAKKGKCTRRNVGSDVRMSYTRTPPANTVIEIKTDAHGDDISWTLKDLLKNKVIASIPTGFYDDNDLHTERIFLEDGDYNFTIKDSVGDGIAADEGHYAIYDNGKEVLRGFPGPFKSRSYVFRIGYDPEQDMTNRDKAWLKAHNRRRQEFHRDHGVSYVPLMWSPELKEKAEDCVDHALQDCGVERLHITKDIKEGENAFGDKGLVVHSPEQVLNFWVEKKEGLGYPENDVLTQVYWRASKFVGCASGFQAFPDDRICERHVCLYTPAGNCEMLKHDADKRNKWMKPTLEKYSHCGHTCPEDGCYVSDFDGQ